MKLIFESWRRYLTEASIEPEEGKRIEALLKEVFPTDDWSVMKKLGKGMGGQVYLIQNENTIERRALKVIEPRSRFYDTESPNYAWVAKNRESLPEEVKKYLPKVFSVDRTKSGTDLIQMEVLTNAPEDVLADLIVPSSTKYEPTKRQIDVLLSDIDTVRDLVSDAVREATNVLDRAGLAARRKQMIAEKIAKKIMKEWQAFYDDSIEAVFPGQKKPKFFDPSPNWVDPLGKLKSIVEIELFDIEKIFMSIVSIGLGDLEKKFKDGELEKMSKRLANHAIAEAFSVIDYTVQKAPIPLGVAKKVSSVDTHTPEKAALFPEAQGLLNAINTLKKKYGFMAQDIHSGNVMARPKSGDLVIVDLGLFKQKKKDPKPLGPAKV